MNSLSVFIYDFSIRIYSLGIFVAAFFNSKAKMFWKGRMHLLSEIARTLRYNEKIIWMHCASVGEFEQGKPVLEKIKSEFPQYKIVLTFYSPSGFNLRKKISLADYIFYLPLDTKKNAEEFIRLVNPDLAIFVKYEFWYHHLNELHKKNIPSILISGIFRDDQIFFKWFGQPLQKILHFYQMIFVQDENSFQLLKENGIVNSALSSDTRFDRVLQIKTEAKNFDEVEKFCNENQVVVCGSTWKEDQNIILDYIHSNPGSKLKWIIAPHEIFEETLQELQMQLGEKSVRFSQLNHADSEMQYLIIDNIGMLSGLYRYAKVAYVGGGFGKGIHNILEAAVYGAPVLFGPNYKKFKEATDLSEKKFCFSISGKSEFSNQLNELIANQKLYSSCSEGCKNYVQSRAGATTQIVEYLKKHIH